MDFKYPEVAARVVLPEDLPNWGFDAVYPDILQLEQHLGALASVVVIFVESPGSIAELGAFSLLDGIKEKLLVVVREYHSTQQSFIQLGPIRHLKHADPNAVHIFPWDVLGAGSTEKIDPKSVENIRDEICELINDRLPSHRTVQPFDSHSNKHLMLLVCTVIQQMIGLTITEIRQYLGDMGIQITQQELKKFLFVLKHLDLIDVKTRGNQELYFALDQLRYVRFAIKDSAGEFDPDRLQMAIAEYYAKADGTRSKALKHALAGVAPR
jgi:hypothetical protein